MKERVRYGRILGVGLFALVLLAGCDPRYGFVESNVGLAADSPLPKFVSIPSRFARQEVTVEFIFFTYGAVRVVVKGPPPERQILFSKMGSSRWDQPTQQRMKEAGTANVWPKFMIVEVDQQKETLIDASPNSGLAVYDSPTVPHNKQ